MISINDFYDLVMPRLKNIPHIIYNGTLWSIIQGYDLHVDENDIDLLFPIKYQKQIRDEFSEFDVLRDDEYHLYLEFEGRKLDCYLYKDCGEYISEASSYIIMADERGIDPEKLSMHWDKDLIFPTQSMIYRNILVQIPAKPHEMLEKHFGKAWKKWETPFTATNIGKVEIHRTVFDHRTELFYTHKNTPYYYDKDGVRYSHLPTKPDS